MHDWDEIRTAFHVARMGTVSGAAEVLGVHHATVIRHIDSLEQRMGVKLFQRHARGYTATEAGEDLSRVAQATDDQFTQLAGRIRGRGSEVAGELVVTSIESLAPRLVPIFSTFQQTHPQVSLRYLTGTRLFRLEYGEAHVAVRAGNPPDQPDNVVQKFYQQKVSLFASSAYAARHGLPRNEADLANHRFVAFENTTARAPFTKWLYDRIDEEAMVFRSSDTRVLEAAIDQGAGIGFRTVQDARENPDLIEVVDAKEDWTIQLWLVTHVDLHRTGKVQALLKYLKEKAADWPVD